MAANETAGIDWASEAHEVCVVEEGRGDPALRGDPRRARHRRRLPASSSGSGSAGSRSSAPTASWSSGCWRPGWRSWRSTPTSSRPPAPASRSPTASPIASTLSSWPSWPAPTPIASGRSCPTRSDQGAAGADPRPRRAGRGPRRAGQPAARSSAGLLARRAGLRRRRQPDLARLLGALPDPRLTPRAWAPGAWPPSSRVSATAAAPTPPSSSRG